MKSILSVAMLMVFCFTGCKQATVQQPLAPGYANKADQSMEQALVAANAFFNTIKCESQKLNWDVAQQSCVVDSKVTEAMMLSTEEKTALNSLGIALNIAQPIYLAYHAGTATQQQAQAAVDNVGSAEIKVQSMLPKGVN